MRILIVEDDPGLARALQQRFRTEGYAVDLANNGIDGEFMGTEEAYDAIVLDLGLPRRAGLEVLQNWRDHNVYTPVLILTARDAWHEKVEGFKAGADDYLPKPFHIEELLARVNALIRRCALNSGGGTKASGLTLDEDTQNVTLATGEKIELTATEYRLLRYLMHNPGKILSKSRLAEHIYEYDDERDSNVIEVYVNRLRHKLGKDLITTKRGQGYVFGDTST